MDWHGMALRVQGGNAPRDLFDAAVMVRWLVVRRWLERVHPCVGWWSNGGDAQPYAQPYLRFKLWQ